MSLLTNTPISRKLTIMLLVASVSVLLLASICFSTYQWLTLRNLIKEDLMILAEVTASNVTSRILQNNAREAVHSLKTLSAKPGLCYANISLDGRGVFAAFGTFEGMADGPNKLSADGFDQDGPFLTLRHPITTGGRRIGTLLLVFDFESAQRRMAIFHAAFSLLILGAAVGAAIFLSSSLQKIVSQPIIDLAETARGITKNNDYTIRASSSRRDEIGQFADAFNQMIAQIQKQDKALQEAPVALELQVEVLQREIAERKRVEESLRAAELKYRSLVEQLPVITYNSECGNTGVWFYVSPQIEAIMGYSPEEWVGDPDIWRQQIHPEDREEIFSKASHMKKNGDQFINEYRMYDRYGRLHWFRDHAVVVSDEVHSSAYTHGFLLDITEQKQAEVELGIMQGQLMDISRQAGMAEVATGVLHNVGNVLNSVNVSATLLGDRIKASKLASFSKVTHLLRENAGNLAKYITSNPKGKLLPSYLISLSEHLSEEHVDMLTELDTLTKNIEHIKDIVSMQQSYARVSTVAETVSVLDIVEDAIRINTPSFTRNGIKVTRNEAPNLPTVDVEKHKVLQILVNLLRNAKNAMEDVPRKDRKISVDVCQGGANTVRIRIKDHGMGIAHENITRIFSHGFTTKTDGHGFGLHIGALAAQDMGGSLTAESDGPGTGATFILDLPASAPTSPP